MRIDEYQPLFEGQRSAKKTSPLTRLKKWLLLSIVFVLSAFVFFWKRRYDSHSLKVQSTLSGGRQTARTFQLKHIYHQNTKTFDLNQPARLDITDDFIRVNGLDTDISVHKYEKTWSKKYPNQSPWNVNLSYKSNPIEMKRMINRDPAFVESYLDYARTNPILAENIALEWNDELVDAPNISDKDTVTTLALMSSNAYVEIPDTGDWRDVHYNNSFGYGWNGTGVRGHVFVSDDNSTVVLAYKGTSAAYLSGSGNDDTVIEDKENDNLLFSCCCARVSYMWTTVCDCYESSYTCNQSCLEKELIRKDKYYYSALNVYKGVLEQYPKSNIWLTGHSLGGALASFVGRSYGVPAVSFESPGELLATKRLHLPMPPGLPEYIEGIWHFGHTADPIFMGVCNGASSSCSVAGYAMETQCHSGRQCIYDVVTDKGWHVNMLNHRIHTVIDDVIGSYNDTAKCIQSPPCRDCFSWNFVNDNHGFKDKDPQPSETTTASEEPEPTKEPKCIEWTWYGRCIKYSDEMGGNV